MSNPKTQYDIEGNVEMVPGGSKVDPVWYLSAWKRVSSAFGAFPSIHLTHSPRGGRMAVFVHKRILLVAYLRRMRERERMRRDRRKGDDIT